MSGKVRRNHNITPGNWKADILKYVGGALFGLVLLFSACVLLIDLIVPHIPIEAEQKLFDALNVAGFTIEGDRQPAMEAEIRGMLAEAGTGCDRLQRPVTVEVVKNDMVNAFAMPGGRIVVMTGLLDRLDYEDELLFVVGHEMGHIANRDHLGGLLRNVLLSGIMVVLERATGLDLSSDPLDLTAMAFNRGEEAAADRAGIDFVQCARGHVAGARHFMETMGKLGDLSALTAYLSTHPAWKERIKRFEVYEREMDYTEGRAEPLPDVFR